jgi:hypothetical protein
LRVISWLAGRHGQALEDAVEVVGDPGVIVVHVDRVFSGSTITRSEPLSE